MRLALALGRRNNGRTWPNPSVGAVLVDASSGPARILAQGATAPGGRPHAETMALEKGGGLARGATLYVSLEPCSHHGRTPPCVGAILAAGVARVVTSLDDPDPRVGGRGHARLRAAGVEVATGILACEAERAHRGHLTRIREGRPAVTLKLARTADGYAASGPGEGRLMISGEGAWGRTHLARAHADAILVGVGTVLADDPRLDVRLPGLEARSPARVVLDTRLRLPLSSRLVRSAGNLPTFVVCGTEADRSAERELGRRGVEIIRAAADTAGTVDLAAAMRALAARGITRVLSEGGPTLADALAAADLVDEVVLMTNDMRLDCPGLTAVGPRLASRLASFVEAEAERVGPDLFQRYERR